MKSPHSIKSSYDALIIGSGPAGCATAAALAQKGKAVLLVEAKPEGCHRFAGEWLHPPGVDVLKRLGLQNITESPNRFKGKGFVVYPADRSRPILLDYPDGKHALSFIHGHFVKDLREKVSKQEGLDYVEHLKVSKIEENEVELVSLTQETLGQKYTVYAEMIIGAEGRSSMVRKKFKDAPKGETVSVMTGIMLENAKLPYWEYGHIFLGKPGIVLAYTVAPQKVRICIDVPLEHKVHMKDPQWILDTYCSLIPETVQPAFEKAVKEKKMQWMGNAFLTRSFYGDGRYVLVGDAAGHTHPLTAVGITNGLLDAEALASQPSFEAFRKERTRSSLIPEVLSRALYECFSRKDETSFDLQRATYFLWRKFPKEKKRTMGLLMGDPPSVYDFIAPFSRVLAMGTKIRLRKHFNIKEWKYLPKETLFLLEWVSLPFVFALARVPRNLLPNMAGVRRLPILKGLPSLLMKSDKKEHSVA